MPEDPVALLQRAAEQMSAPSEAYEAVARRRMKLGRNRAVESAVLALGAFGCALAVIVWAFAGATGPGLGPAMTLPEGVAPNGIGSVRMIRSFGASEAVALTERAVIRTADGGRHWTSVTPPGFTTMASSTMFYLDARHGWIVSLPNEKNGTASVSRTTNGGSTWSEASLRLPERLDYDAFAPGHAQAPEIGFSDPLHGWLSLPVRPAPLFITSDGGVTWEAGPMIDGADSLQGITFTSPTEGWAVREHDVALSSTSDLPIQSLYWTKDAGQTWRRVDLPEPPIAAGSARYGPATELGLPIFFGDDGVIAAWAGTKESSALFAYLTHDGGITWSATDPIPIRQGLGSPIFAPSFVSASTWMVSSTSGQLAVTSNGGRSWSIRSVRGIQPHQYAAALLFSTPKTGWAMGCDSWSGGLAGPTVCDGPYTLYRTTDAGGSWTLMLTNLPASRP